VDSFGMPVSEQALHSDFANDTLYFTANGTLDYFVELVGNAVLDAHYMIVITDL
jgi:hypothetical protein